MSESHVISALVTKRSELTALVDYHQNMLKQIRTDMLAIDTSIKIFQPNYDLRSIKGRRKNKKNVFFARGEGNTMILDIFRLVDDTITTNEIVDEVIKRKGFDKGAIDLKALKACIFTMLKRFQKKEIIRQLSGKDEREKRWSHF